MATSPARKTVLRLLILATLIIGTCAWAQTDVLVQRSDLARTGQNLHESQLTNSTVSASTFGKLLTLPVDGYVYAQPLYKSNLLIPGVGTFNVVFVATEHGSVYAFDADSGTPLWHKSFIDPAAGITPQPTSDTGSTDIVPEVSITSTPVIDPAANTLYVVPKTKENGSSVYRIHALDITTGADKVPPTLVQASIPKVGGGTLTFIADYHQQRPALLLLNGVVYVAFGSSGDAFPWAGWLFGYDATTLVLVRQFCASQTGSGAGFWAAGAGPAVDAAGAIYLSTGNGTYNGSTSWGDSYLKLVPNGSGFTVADYFTPFNQQALNNSDLDIATAGVTLLPDAAGSASHPHLLVAAGKAGTIYLVDRDNMGQYNGSYALADSRIVQTIPNALGVHFADEKASSMPYVEDNYSTPAYWQNHVYFCGIADVCKRFDLNNGQLSTTPGSVTGTPLEYGAGGPVISASDPGATSAILWAVQPDNVHNVAILHAYDAGNLATELYGSGLVGSPPVKFVIPTVVGGKVFVGAQQAVDVYGLTASAPQRLMAPTLSPAPQQYPSTIAVTLSAAPGAAIYFTTDGSTPTLSSPIYTGPISVSSTTTIRAIAVEPGYLTSSATVGTYAIGNTASTIAFAQMAYATPQTPQQSISVKYAGAQGAGNLNVIFVGWNDSTQTVTSVTDSSGNVYQLATGPLVQTSYQSQSVYYAPNIASAAPSANTVTVTFSGPAVYPDIRILEYSGADTANPLDGAVGAMGNGSTAGSGSLTTTAANDLLVAGNMVQQTTKGAGTGFTSRIITSPDGDIAEDRLAGAAGSYSATASISGGQWIMQLAAFKPQSGAALPTPSTPGNLQAAAVSSSEIDLSWSAATETGGTITQYSIERCSGAGCSNYAVLTTIAAPATGYQNTGLSASTGYSYRVRAIDAASTAGPYSNVATASTVAVAAPTAPGNLFLATQGDSEIDLSWDASTETGGTISRYLVESCSGLSCSNFAQIGTSTTTAFASTGLTPSTSYSYRVRAQDSAGVNGPYSAIATIRTRSQVVPSAPTNLTAATAGSTEIDLAWGASAEAGGTIAAYLIERCQGAGCSAFTQIATTTGLQYANTGLTGSTSYTYRVRAQDSTAHTGDYSNDATATTAVPVAPTAPANLFPNAVSDTEIDLSWGASTETGGTISRYLIERCSGVGCSSFAQIGTSTTTAFASTGLTGSTSYSFRVRAQDALGVNGPYSGVATVSTQTPVVPTAPGSLTATAAGAAEIDLAWGASTETGGTISAYLIERCQGAGCTNFVQIATTSALQYANTGLTASTSYSYRVRAQDTAARTGAYSNTATAVTASGGGGGSNPPPIAFVQTAYATPQTSKSSVAVTFGKAQVAGNLNVIVVGWNDSTATITSVTDTRGNAYQLAAAPTVMSGHLSQAIYYAAGIPGATAGSNTVTVNFSAAAVFVDVRIAEYSGIATASPLDGSAGAFGSSTISASPSITTSNANDLLIGANMVETLTSKAGTSFTSRVITSPDGDILEDRTVTAAGTYAASATLKGGGPWIMQIVAFKRSP